MNLNVADTAQTIDQIAVKFRGTADDLDRMAQSMREKKDLSYAAEALTICVQAIANCRLDLLVTRPLREYELANRALKTPQTEG